jgi:tetratricopeptide (TPR) repeat protein
VEDRFGRYPDWNAVINNCGPFDDPRFTFEQARVFLQGGNYRQALNHFLRAAELEPASLTPRIWLADVWIQLNRPAEALALLADIRSRAAHFGINPTNEHHLVRIEAAARFRAGETEAARNLLERALARPGAPDELRLAATQLYLQHGLFAEAVAQFDVALAKNPADVLSHANRGYACLQLNRVNDALESLNRALELDSRNNVVRLNRAIARYRAGLYAEARADYEELLAASPDAFQAHFGLGEVATALKDDAEALKHYERYLRTAPRQTAEYLQVSNRVVELRARR